MRSAERGQYAGGVVENNNCGPLSSLERIQAVGKDAGLPGVSLTLSDALVQFLSSLQLQGYASRLIDLFGMCQIEELAARVSCEDDVKQLLGERSSFQQRRELWRGICKWKLLTRKRMRERDKKPGKRSVTGANAPAEAVDCLDGARTEAVCFGASERCTPSQFMYQFAFQGYEGNRMTMVAEKGERKQQSSTVSCLDDPAPASEAFPGQTCDTSCCERLVNDVLSTSTTPRRRSASQFSSVSPCCSSQFPSAKRYRRERLPLALLSVGLAAFPSEADELADVWGIPSEDAMPKPPLDSSVSAVEPPQSPPEGEPSVGELVEEFRAEHERLCKEMHISIENAVGAYNKKLRALQNRFFFLCSSTRQSNSSGITGATSCEVALTLGREPQLRVEAHPATFYGAVIVVSADVDNNALPPTSDGEQRLMGSLGLREPPDISMNDRGSHENDRTSLLASATIVSPSSESFRNDAGLLSAREVPTLSDMTTPGRESHKCIDMLMLEDCTWQANTKSTNITKPMSPIGVSNHIPNLPATDIPDRDTVLSFSGIQQDETIIETTAESQCSNAESQNVEVEGNVVVEGKAPCLHESALTITAAAACSPHSLLSPLRVSRVVHHGDTVHCDIAGSTGMSSIEHFGLQDSNMDEMNAKAYPFYRLTPNEDMLTNKGCAQAAAERQVIDVDAFSSSQSDVLKTSLTLFPDCDDDDCTIHAGDCSQHATQQSNLIEMDVFAPQDDHLGLYVQPLLQRQRAVSRAASSPSFALETTEVDVNSLSLCENEHVRKLDWTVASSIVADVHHLQSRLPPVEGFAGTNDINDESNEERNTSISSTLPPPQQQQRPVVPSGLPPLPLGGTPMGGSFVNLKDDVNTSVECLKPDMIKEMSYESLCKWCMRLGLHLPRDELQHSNLVTVEEGDEEWEDVNSGMSVSCAGRHDDCMLREGENSSGWWLLDDASDASHCMSDGYKDDVTEKVSRHLETSLDRDLHLPTSRQQRDGKQGGVTPPATPQLPDDDVSEWSNIRRAATEEQMREALRIYIARRYFIHDVVPSFFHRLPSFSGGPPYKRVRAAELVRSHVVLTQQDLDEQRRLSRIEEQEEAACCVITSLAGDAAESIERQALSIMRKKDEMKRQHVYPSSCIQDGSSIPAYNETENQMSVYEKILLMEPTDLQAAVSIVQADFPHVSRNRVEQLLEESGIPLDTCRPMLLNNNRGNTSEVSMTQNSSLSQTPPPQLLTQTLEQRDLQTQNAKQKKRFFIQNSWPQRAKGG